MATVWTSVPSEGFTSSKMIFLWKISISFFCLFASLFIANSSSDDASEATNSSCLECPFDTLEGDVVVIHGMAGSRLVRRKDKKLLFVTEGLVEDEEHPDINLGINKRWGDRDDVINDGFLSSEPWLPFYTPFLDAIQDAAKKSNGRFNVHLFDFDFRRDNMYTTQNFMQFLARLKYGDGGYDEQHRRLRDKHNEETPLEEESRRQYSGNRHQHDSNQHYDNENHDDHQQHDSDDRRHDSDDDDRSDDDHDRSDDDRQQDDDPDRHDHDSQRRSYHANHDKRDSQDHAHEQHDSNQHRQQPYLRPHDILRGPPPAGVNGQSAFTESDDHDHSVDSSVGSHYSDDMNHRDRKTRAPSPSTHRRGSGNRVLPDDHSHDDDDDHSHDDDDDHSHDGQSYDDRKSDHTHDPDNTFDGHESDYSFDNTDLHHTGRRLDSKRGDRRGRRLTVIAHSMGGVITYAVANMRPGLIDAAVFAGTPFKGSITALEGTLKGMPIGNNSVIFNTQNRFLLRSGFSFFPPDGTGLLKDGKNFEIDYFRVHNWVKYGLSPELRTKEKTKIGSYGDRLSYLNYAVDKAKGVRDLVYYKPLPVEKLPKVAVIQGEDQDTVHRYPVTLDRDGYVKPDFDNAETKPGDGVVTVESSTFPIAGAVASGGVVKTKEAHATLLNDFEAVRQAIESVA